METTEDRKQRRRSRLILLSLAAMFIVPLLVAAWLYQRVQEGEVWATVNHGRLIEPAHPLTPFELEGADGKRRTLEALRGQWTMIFLPETPCRERCRRTIYHMRQVWAALGRESPRVQRWLVLDGAAQYTELADFLENYPSLQVLTDTGEGLTGQLTGTVQVEEPAVYLVDPLGNLMMAFPRSLDPRDVLKDLKKLLKISRVG